MQTVLSRRDDPRLVFAMEWVLVITSGSIRRCRCCRDGGSANDKCPGGCTSSSSAEDLSSRKFAGQLTTVVVSFDSGSLSASTAADSSLTCSGVSWSYVT